ncbi:MAG TPA: hypothetical protein VMF14_02780 [Solirubrobacteraceae bacterium]|nr:hypothetical protein [Solirubrobacteraceae bacterium]
MSTVAPALSLALARARRRPWQGLAPALGIALAAAFLGAVWAQGTVTGEQAARAQLAGLSPAQRAVAVTWQGTATPTVDRQARAALTGLGLGPTTSATLLSAVRLDGHLVRPAAISPLASWTDAAAPGAQGEPGEPGGRPGRGLGPCHGTTCPMLLDGTGISTGVTLRAPGVGLTVAGRATLRSTAPLGFVPGQTPGPPVLLGGDPAGLQRLPGLSSFYRTESWLALLPVAGLHSWQLPALRRRLQRDQATLLAQNSAFTMAAPFTGLDAAIAEARSAPRRLLLVAGGGVAALALFLVLVVGGMRGEVQGQLERLRTVGARSDQLAAVVAADSALICGAALVAGAAVAVMAAAILAGAAHEPIGGILTHSLVTWRGLAALAGGWLVSMVLVAALVTAPTGVGGIRLPDVAAVAAAAALALALADSGSGSGSTVQTILLAPLCALAAGVLVLRLCGALLMAGERAARRGPMTVRLAFVGLARRPALPSLWVAFVAVAVGLGGFALSYRATLARSAADQAAAAVPLDAIVSPGPSFATPLTLASPRRWAALSHGTAWPVRRTQATFVSGEASVTVPALGVPATALARLHGWRASDGSAPLATLARRLAPAGPVGATGLALPPGARRISVRTGPSQIAATVTGDLRDGTDTIHRVSLGDLGPGAVRDGTLRARLPAHAAGRWELAGFELDEPAGLEATNGHQNGENVAAGTQATGTVTLGAVSVTDASGALIAGVSPGWWRGVGAASGARPTAGGEVRMRFADSGQPGIIRPPQPSDTRPVPVLTDPETAAAAGRDGTLALTVDGEPVTARIAGVVRRFPTVPAGSAGFVVADEPTLAAALDAQLPGQGRPDELWISSRNLAPLRAALAAPPLASLQARYRRSIEQGLRDAPVARAVQGTLIAAAALSAALAILGLPAVLLGPGRDAPLESDLIDQGASPSAVRAQLRLQAIIASALGVAAGALLAVILARLAVTTIRAVAALAAGAPPLVTVNPAAQLVIWSAGGLAALAAAACLATTGHRRRARS